MMRRFLRVIRITLFVIRFPFLFSYSLLGESWTGVLFGFHLLVHLKLWGFLFVYYVLFFIFLHLLTTVAHALYKYCPPSFFHSHMFIFLYFLV